ncbi:ATP-binding protein [Methanotorris igneus]|uniref:AAA ATPase n=1 Tax=Methanotorris igneus (strain DSM 5666 / JCM 11834 / Kol 5) TaxID=880724 RepID=F6BE11_METIK|nr:ATP-binding protein [Methanotorris igneus]AEF96722.1 AAA ATPase [Methanotorris igneus Kol 5]
MQKFKFYDREKELNYLKTYCQLLPNSILFVYGPKSSGKSTVMKKVIKDLENRGDLVFFYYNLREYATPTKEEFLNIFFEKGDKKYIQNSLVIDIKVFKFGIEENFDFNNVSLNDVFRRIKEDINTVVKEKKIPILIIDELQKLKNIYFNGGKSLLNELFNLFVSLTKMEHLCHVICLTSDSLFINEIYTNSSLAETSEYYLIDWLKKEDIKRILKEEGFNEKEVNFAVNYVSLPYEITQLINNRKLGVSVEDTIRNWINVERDRLKYLIDTSDIEEERILNALKKFKDKIKISYVKDVKKEEFSVFKYLIENEILFYDVVNGIIKPHSLKKIYAIRRILEER